MQARNTRHRHSADEDTAITLCRQEYEGDCRCERNGSVICEPMLRRVREMATYLKSMRAAFEGHYPEDLSQ